MRTMMAMGSSRLNPSTRAGKWMRSESGPRRAARYEV
jgi:hypothetical protein